MGSASFEKPSTSTHVMVISFDFIFCSSSTVFWISYLSWYSSRRASFASAVLEYFSYKNLADLRSYTASLPTIPNFFATHHVLQFTLCVPAREACTISFRSYSSAMTSLTGCSKIRPFDESIILYASERESTRYPLFADIIEDSNIARVELIRVPKQECITTVFRTLCDSITIFFSSGMVPSFRLSITLFVNGVTIVFVRTMPTFFAVV